VAEIVLVHGAFHELWGPTRLALRWAPSLLDGLWTAGFRIHQQDLDRINGGLRVAFWGDLFRPTPTPPEDEAVRHDEDAVDLGSPLGDGVVTAAIDRDGDGRLPWPGGVRNWTNVAAEGDLATAAAPRLAPIVAGAVGDEFVFNGLHPHDIEPYLTTTAVGRAVARGLGLDEPTAR